MRSGYYNGEMVTIVVPLIIMSALLLVVSLPNIQCASYRTDPSIYLCVLSKTEPNLDDLMKKVKNFASANDTALANMIGYLHFHGKGYMPLVLSRFYVDEEKATLADECATLTWKYETDGSMVHLYDLKLDVPAFDVASVGNTLQHTCRVNNYFYLFPPDERFSCKTKMSGGCRPEQGESLVDIVMGSFELELSGDPSKISKGEFSSIEPAYMSCSVFG